MRTPTIESLRKRIENAESFIARAAKKQESLGKWKAQLAELESPEHAESLAEQEKKLEAQLARIRAQREAVAEVAESDGSDGSEESESEE